LYSVNINTDAAVIHTNRLERMGRNALPNAIRNALNSTAFDVKQNTMPKVAKHKFINRAPNFFKANSKVEMARGFNVNTMQSKVGFVPNRSKGVNQAVKDLEQQEHGGKIEKRSFIATDTARGGSGKSLVRPINRLSRIKNIVDVKNASGKNYGQKFIKSVIYAGKGGFVKAKFKGRETLWRVNSIKRKDNKFKLTPIYTYKKGRSVQVDETGFMRKASLLSARKMEDFYIKAARRELARV
jgi:hypothetical protein